MRISFSRSWHPVARLSPRCRNVSKGPRVLHNFATPRFNSYSPLPTRAYANQILIDAVTKTALQKPHHTAFAMDQIKEMADVPQEFVKEGLQFINRCTKPDKREFISTLSPQVERENDS